MKKALFRTRATNAWRQFRARRKGYHDIHWDYMKRIACEGRFILAGASLMEDRVTLDMTFECEVCKMLQTQKGPSLWSLLFN